MRILVFMRPLYLLLAAVLNTVPAIDNNGFSIVGYSRKLHCYCLFR